PGYLAARSTPYPKCSPSRRSAAARCCATSPIPAAWTFPRSPRRCDSPAPRSTTTGHHPCSASTPTRCSGHSVTPTNGSLRCAMPESFEPAWNMDGTAMKLHWSPKSPFVRKVMIAAHELDLLQRIELVRSVAAMKQPNPAIMADNPLAKIPTLVLPDGDALYDSAVICEYLDALVDGPLFPRAGAARWQALRWQALGDGLLDLLLLWRNEREREAPLAELIGAFELKTRATLQRLEREADALASTPFAIGHLALVCAL